MLRSFKIASSCFELYTHLEKYMQVKIETHFIISPKKSG